ncbi:DUF3098 domain-containing protein [Capnocytophaga sp. oral taxon 323]|jgi:hypothetical protein|uniref:DUF3098 domain-containing protein n=1 Tax=unclassified Capnocytophaga TaxID=2640652 RepID=UPI0006ADA1D0|nr:DUF3098 domain-containing protein [Capnocytophaga sp. oral taxon 323]ALC96772.1 hypothetical protein AM608_03430 [Capnocytophaga sp. oral taxon 323]
MKHHSTFIFEKKNYLIMAIGLIVIALGFITMSGGGSDNPAVFDPSIFNFRRIHLAPALVLLGFAIEIYAILVNPKTDKKQDKK